GVREKARDELLKLSTTPERIRKIEEFIRSGRTYEAIKENRQTLTVAIGGDKQLTIQVQLPPNYDPAKRYPVMVAMGGGPIATEKIAKTQASTMLKVWSKPAEDAGWMVAAVEDTISVRKAGKALRYQMLRADQMRPILDALVERYAIDPNRMH